MPTNSGQANAPPLVARQAPGQAEGSARRPAGLRGARGGKMLCPTSTGDDPPPAMPIVGGLHECGDSQMSDLHATSQPAPERAAPPAKSGDDLPVCRSQRGLLYTTKRHRASRRHRRRGKQNQFHDHRGLPARCNCRPHLPHRPRRPAVAVHNRTGKVAPEHRRLMRYPTMTLAEIKALPVADSSTSPPTLPLGAERAAA